MKRLVVLCLPVLLLLSGCLDRSYSVKELHESRYWESTAEEILRAENYQDFVSIILLALEEHQEETTIRLYLDDVSYPIAFAMVKDACTEVQTETAIGCYLLHNLSFDMQELREGSFEVILRPDYRKTAEDFAATIHTPSSSAVYELLLTALKEGKESVVITYAYAAETPEVLRQNILTLQQEMAADAAESEQEAPSQENPVSEEGTTPEQAPLVTPWQVIFYPETTDSTTVEIIFTPQNEK